MRMDKGKYLTIRRYRIYSQVLGVVSSSIAVLSMYVLDESLVYPAAVLFIFLSFLCYFSARFFLKKEIHLERQK